MPKRTTHNRNMSIAGHIGKDVEEFSNEHDTTAPDVGLDMGGHDTYLMGPKIVMLDSFVVDLLNVDTSAQTFRLKLLLNMDWEDDGTIEPEFKVKRNLARTGTTATIPSVEKRMTAPTPTVGDRRTFKPPVKAISMMPPLKSVSRASSVTSMGSTADDSLREDSVHQQPQVNMYKTGKYVLKNQFIDDPLSTTWNPEVVLVNAIADESPIEAGSKFHSVQMLSGRPVISKSVLYQPECRCEFTFSNFPFDETDLVVKFSSNKWNSEQVNFMWTHRLASMGKDRHGRRFSKMPAAAPSSRTLRRESSYLRRTVDQHAIGGVGLSEFEIVRVRVETDEKDVNSMQRYDHTEGAFSEAHLIIRVRRDPYSYLLRVASVSELLMFLEALSFLTDSSDLSARFSISGTIFLAMVSLYGPMADALPKVSVVTRVDKWHLYNFFLLFASNVENFFAFLLRSFVSGKLITMLESILAVLYLYAVIRNLIWFIQPLTERDEYTTLVDWIEDKLEVYVDFIQKVADKGKSFLDKICIWRKKQAKDDNDSPNSRKTPRGKQTAQMSFLRRTLTGEKLADQMSLAKLNEGKKLNGDPLAGDKWKNTKAVLEKPAEKKPTEQKPTLESSLTKAVGDKPAEKKPTLRFVDFRNSFKRQGGVRSVKDALNGGAAEKKD